METTNQKPDSNPYFIGLALIAASMIVYLAGSDPGNDFSFFSQTFFINYAISVIYVVIVLANRSHLKSLSSTALRSCSINVVILYTISAFSLNREMNVFAPFPMWLNIYTLLSIPLFLVFPYFKSLPTVLKALVLFLTGVSLTLSFYMFLYLLPLLPLSCLALIALAISIHSFVPAFWLWILFDFIIERIEKNKLRLWILPGALLPLLILVFYLFKWNHLQAEIKQLVAEQNVKLSNQLPDAIYLAQKLPAHAMTEEILVASFKAQRFWGDGFGFEKEGRHRYHNPLSTIAVGMFGEVDLDELTVENILNIRKDYRHNTTRKLWTGISLCTSAISTNIQVFPEYRLAYHEKTIVIHNDPDKHNRDSWFTSRTQEALYTFHVPEGSIVTSLSLWINGQEQKSRLSTSQKADSAYTRIVGVERRDPAVVHWKEGNAVTVNVFPCTTNEDRKFKIGFTTPLKSKGHALSLENIWFEGPDSRHAIEVTQVIMGSSKLLGEAPDEFKPQANGTYLREGDYLPYWQMSLEKPALSPDVFCFGGYSYSMQEAKAEPLRLAVQDVFLDVTKEWTKEEFESLVSRLKAKTVYTWLPEKTRITAENKDLVWESVSKNQFSVPFIYDIEKPQHSVIITKTPYQSPVLDDLKQSDVAGKFTGYLTANTTKLNVLNIGTELSPFWRSLRELRLVNYTTCSADEAASAVLSGVLHQYTEDSTKIAIAESGMAIAKTPLADSLTKSTAPDHVMRLFAYNDLLQKIGRSYFEKEKYENALFREAEEGYVVSPLSSMIVLESEADYERMGIHKNENTVGNAKVLGGGAVPEPHEWLLIGLVAVFIIRHLFKQRLALR